jgi:hypothetical protein
LIYRIYIIAYHATQTTMSNKLLSQIEAGCDGRMKLENGKIVFELGSHMVAPPPPSAPPLMADDSVVDELRSELRETKQRLAVLEQQVQQLFKFRESVYIPKMFDDRMGDRQGNLHNFNSRMVKFIPNGNQINPNQPNQYSPLYDAILSDSCVPIGGGGSRYLRDILHVLKSQLRHDLNHIIIQPRQTITPDCGLVIKFIIDWMATSPNNIEITIMNTGATLAIGFVVGLCEQLNHEKLSKLKITQAKISEQTELRNKVDKTLFRKIEIENLVPSV